MRQLSRTRGAALGLFCDFEGHHAGPQAEQLSECGLDLLLGMLSEQRVKITFNIVADLCRTHPRQIVRIAESGHEIACHGWRHERPRDLASGEIREVLRNAAACFASMGLQPRGFRSPQSAWSLALLRSLREVGYVWNAERERRFGVGPYFVRPGLVRVPVTSDDWDLADGSGTPETLLGKWQSCLNTTVQRQAVLCLGIHEWIVGGNGEYAARLRSFLGRACAQPGLQIQRLGEIAGFKARSVEAEALMPSKRSLSGLQ